MNAQGEDVVAGIRTPEPISHLEDVMPEVYKEFVDIAQKLENHYRDMQDMEFTIENKSFTCFKPEAESALPKPL